MQTARTCGRFVVLGAMVVLGGAFTTSPVHARTGRAAGAHASAGHRAGVVSTAARHGGGYAAYRTASARHLWRGAPVLQCVTFARDESGIELSGNAANWWQNAAGLYERGQRPEVGAVLSFRATGRMRAGHVAVVSRVLSNRIVEVDHAHWGGPGSNGGGIARNVTVVDVSEANDWSAVRVSLGGPGEFGSIYPTYGFIYGRPDTGRILTARADVPAGRAAGPRYDEVAEAPERNVSRR